MRTTEEGEFGLSAILAAAESASPVESVDVVARSLRERLGARSVSFLSVDLVGRKLVRLAEEPRPRRDWNSEQIELEGSDYDRALRAQELLRVPGGGGRRVIAPVTNRGDTIGVLELTLPDDAGGDGDKELEEVQQAAHALAYLIATDRRFTDLYHWGRRTTRVSLAAEIQHQLLPAASCCEAPQFTAAAALVPADSVGGDTYDFCLDRETVHLSVTDAMGHDVRAALLATVVVNALRRARRAGVDIVEQARQAHRAISEQGRGEFVTGLLVRVGLDGRGAQLVNAGHQRPLRLRGGTVEEVPLTANLPFGVDGPAPAASYRAQELDIRPGDRLVLYTDGMRDRGAATVDLPALVRETSGLHPREAVHVLTGAVVGACRGNMPDDASVLCLDWRGPAAA